MRTRIMLLCVFLLTAIPNVWAESASVSVSQKADECIETLHEIMKIPEKNIPPNLLQQAEGIAIVPAVVKLGFVLGGRHGEGILVSKTNGKWAKTDYMSLSGGSIGWQIGAQSTDVILIFKSQKSIASVLQSKVTLGADIAIAAGPIGRQAEAGTDVYLRAEIFSYSRARGLFAGVSIEGSVIQTYAAKQIPSEKEQRLFSALERYSLNPDGKR